MAWLFFVLMRVIGWASAKALACYRKRFSPCILFLEKIFYGEMEPDFLFRCALSRDRYF